WFPPSLVSACYQIVDFVVDQMVAGPINKVRGELGLPPVKKIMGNYWHSPRLTLGLWPEWYGPPQKDWPPSLKLTGFPLFDGDGAQTTSAGLKEFLEEDQDASGSAPVIFTAGSAMKQGHKFFAQS